METGHDLGLAEVAGVQLTRLWKTLDRLAVAALVLVGLGLLWTPTSSSDEIGLFGFGE